MDDALRKLAQSVRVIRSLHRGAGGQTDRINMSHKDVVKRVPELTEGARHLTEGKIPSKITILW